MQMLVKMAVVGAIVIVAYTVVLFVLINPQVQRSEIHLLLFCANALLVFAGAVAVRARAREWANDFTPARRLRIWFAGGLMLLATLVMVAIALSSKLGG